MSLLVGDAGVLRYHSGTHSSLNRIQLTPWVGCETVKKILRWLLVIYAAVVFAAVSYFESWGSSV